MGIKTLKPAPDPLAFIAGASKPEPVAVAEAEKKPKPTRFFVYVDEPLLARIDRERKRRGGVGRSTLLKLLAAEHLPE